jgi:hypothetical protein
VSSPVGAQLAPSFLDEYPAQGIKHDFRTQEKYKGDKISKRKVITFSCLHQMFAADKYHSLLFLLREFLFVLKIFEVHAGYL